MQGFAIGSLVGRCSLPRAPSLVSDKGGKCDVLNDLARLITAVEVNGERLPSRLLLNSHNFCRTVDRVSRNNGTEKAHVLLAVNQTENIDIQLGVSHDHHQREPACHRTKQRWRKNAFGSVCVKKPNVILIIRTRVGHGCLSADDIRLRVILFAKQAPLKSHGLYSLIPVPIVDKTNIAAFANNKVVQNVDTHHLSDLPETLGDLEVFLARHRITTGVVMHEDSRRG